MNNLIWLVLAAMLWAAPETQGDNIILKKSLWGLQYSTDSVKFDKVGIWAGHLRPIVAGNAQSNEKLDEAAPLRTLGLATSLTGLGLISWSAVRLLSVKWNTADWQKVGVGAGFLVLSSFFNKSADDRVVEAVQIYNRNPARPPSVVFGPTLGWRGDPGICCTITF